MVKRLIKLVILVPLGVLIVVLSVANRHTVRLALNPFNPDDSLLAISLPFFIFMFIALMSGVLIGSVATWFSQGTYRKKARNEAHAAKTLIAASSD